ncbi:hypothetical protein DV515_00008245 [Chloebia gouldiae]|uniref:Uncharacterized protein n=1 Tax=Chloebia gouldiae TaxID=44316 RepID=A0A3L8SFF1_CHLGU|nr:hypothetical protein DV515_00008245 [Chloebia gouldiae]
MGPVGLRDVHSCSQGQRQKFTDNNYCQWLWEQSLLEEKNKPVGSLKIALKRETVRKMNPAVYSIVYLPEYGKRPNELSEMVSAMLKKGRTELEGRSCFKAGFFISLYERR